jgi:plasmid stabilization system protein ParE
MIVEPLCAQETQTIVDNDQIKVELTQKFEGCTSPPISRFGGVRMPVCSEVAITNKSAAPITAWAAVAATGTGFPPRYEDVSVLSADSLPDKHWEPVAPGATRRLETLGYTHLEFNVAIFADGSVFGQPEWVERVLRNRRQIYQHTAVAFQKLREAKEAGTPCDQLVREFRELERQEPTMEIVAVRCGGATVRTGVLTFQLFGMIAGELEASQAASKEDTLRYYIDQQESRMLDYGRRLLTSKPPITDHPVQPGEPLETPPSVE